MTGEVILLFDGDKAGERGALRAVAHALDVPKARFQVVRLPQKHDPDSFIRENGPEAFNELLANAQDLLDFAITSKIENAHDLAIPQIIDSEVIPWMQTVKDPIKRSYLAGKVATLSGVSRDTIDLALQPKVRKAAVSKEEKKPQNLHKNQRKNHLGRPLLAS